MMAEVDGLRGEHARPVEREGDQLSAHEIAFREAEHVANRQWIGRLQLCPAVPLRQRNFGIGETLTCPARTTVTSAADDKRARFGAIGAADGLGTAEGARQWVHA